MSELSREEWEARKSLSAQPPSEQTLTEPVEQTAPRDYVAIIRKIAWDVLKTVCNAIIVLGAICMVIAFIAGTFAFFYFEAKDPIERRIGVIEALGVICAVLLGIISFQLSRVIEHIDKREFADVCANVEETSPSRD